MLTNDRCRHGHDWSVNGRTGPDGKRRCRECNRIAAAEYRKRKARSAKTKRAYAKLVSVLRGEWL